MRYVNEIDEENISKKSNKKRAFTTTSMISMSPKEWIELGKNTGGGSQLDIVRHITSVLILPLLSVQGTTNQLRLKTPQGINSFKLTFTKDMRRFMNLQQGFDTPLGPNLAKPSPYIRIIDYSSKNKLPSIGIADKDSKNARKLIKKYKELGFIGKSVTNSRERVFGWV